MEMGDNDYVCRSERARQEGREVDLAEERKVGLTEGRMASFWLSPKVYTNGRRISLGGYTE